MNEEYMNRGCCKDTMGNLDKKEFMKIMDTSSDFGNTSDIEHLWQWIEQYAIEMCKKQKISCIEELRKVYSDGIKPLANIIGDAPLPKELNK